MDLHPLVVHFPIALLTIYSLFEFVRLERFTREKAWMYIKAVFVIIGAGGAVVARQTGEIARELNRPRQEVVQMHETFANITTVIFGFLAISYALLLIDEFFGEKLRMKCPNGWPRIMNVRARIFSNPLVVLLAGLGLVALTVTGGLGGMLVYGAQADPFTSLINKLFFQI